MGGLRHFIDVIHVYNNNSLQRIDVDSREGRVKC